MTAKGLLARTRAPTPAALTFAIAAVASRLEPLTATLLGAAVFGEWLGPAGAAGAVLLLGGLVVRAVAR